MTDDYTYTEFGEVETYTAYAPTPGPTPIPSPTPIFEVTYDERDDLGRILAKTERIQGGSPDTYLYEYDNRGRLKKVTKNSVLIAEYDYDENGNRTEGPNLTEPPTYDDQDRLLAYEDATYTYTANGELETKTDPSGTTTYEYDALGNLRRVELPSGEEIEYLVDGLGRRIGKKLDGDLVQGFLWEDQLRIAAELNPNGTIKSRFVYGDRVNVPDYMVTDTATYRIITDHLGSPRFVVNVMDGSILQRIDYDEFGNPALIQGSWDVQPFGFAGGLYDSETGLVRFGERDYDTQVGRWTTKDPILVHGDDMSFYAYLGNDPVNWVDPLGLMKLPPNPSGLSDDWAPDPAHKDPNGQRFRDGAGRPLDFHKGRPGEPGQRGKDHWHDPNNSGKRHLRPGAEIPDPAPRPRPGWWQRLPRFWPGPFPLVMDPCLIDPTLPGCKCLA